MAFKRALSQRELEQEAARIMNGDSDSEPFEDSGSDWEEDNLEIESSNSDLSDSDNEPVEDLIAPSYSDEQTEKDAVSDDIENVSTSTSGKSKYIVIPTKKSFTGKDGHKWSTEVPHKSRRTASRNIIHFISGPRGTAKDCNTVSEHFLHFFPNTLLEIILQHTNAEIIRQAEKYSSHENVSQITIEELKALFAVLVLSAAKKDNHLSAKHMFNVSISGTFYRACMSQNRFTFLLNCIRFDEKETRQERQVNDPFTHIREIWDIFIEICRTSFTPSSYLTIDEQLLGFRGRCPFRMYIPNKPAKYGIKIVMVCDCSSKYMLDASPYLGKKTNSNGLPLAEYYVKELTKSVHGSNRNVTMDNWFTSVKLFDELLQEPHKLTALGTLRKNKKEIPAEMLTLNDRKITSSIFCFDQKKTLLSYFPKKQKLVLLLSTMHETAEVSEETGRPVIVQNYNSTKSGVDTFDQMCSNMSCNRKTRRWPLCVFYDMINMASINSYVIYTYNTLKKGQKPVSRFQYMIELSQSLGEPWMRQRFASPTLRRNIRQDIAQILKIPTTEDVPTHQERKRKICFYCPSKKRRMTTTYCQNCKLAICGEHRGEICTECSHQ